jgi:outer membrane protein assembly factor BamB
MLKIMAAISKNVLPSNGVLYFVNGDDAGSIYSIDKDGKNKTKLTDKTCDELITFQEKIYFTSTDGLYSMDLDGSNLEMVYRNLSRIFSL